MSGGVGRAKAALGVGIGLALLAGVIAYNYADLARSGGALRRAPLGLAVSLGVHAGQITLTAAAWRTLLAAGGRPGLGAMMVLRWIRESLNALLPAGAIIGQAIATKRLIGAGVTAELASATATVDLTVEAATQAAFTILGVALLLLLYPDYPLSRVALAGIAVAVGAAATALAVQRHLPVRAIERVCARLLARWVVLEAGWLGGFQRSVLRLHADRPVLVQAVLCHLAGWAIGSVEIAANAALLGHPISLGDGMIVEALTQALRSAAFMIPGGLGLQEGAITLACGLVGVPPDAALVLALLRRTRELLIGLPGLVVWRRGERRRRL